MSVAVVLDVDLGRVGDPAEVERDVGEQVDIALREGEQDEEQLPARLRVEATDHAQVEQPDPTVGPEHVARVRVGVEEALLEDLLVVGLHQLARRLDALRALGGLEQRHPVDDLVHDQQAPGRELAVTARDADPAVAVDDLAHADDVARLLAEVELVAEGAGDLLDERRQVDDPVRAAAERDAGPTIISSRARSFSTTSSASGRWTLTTTGWPSAIRARCTWAIVPAASGSGSIEEKTSSQGTASSRSIIATTSASDIGGTSACSAASSATYSSEIRSGRVERIWPSFPKVGPSLSNASRSRRGPSGSPSRRSTPPGELADADRAEDAADLAGACLQRAGVRGRSRRPARRWPC